MITLVRYRVYVWPYPQSKAATVVHTLSAPSIESAIQAVLLVYHLSRAYYVWVVSPQDEDVDVHRYHVVCHALASASSSAPIKRRT